MRFDIHVHTRFSSCSSIGIDELIERAVHVGLDGVCITDHNTMEAVRHIDEGIQSNGLCIICGIEYDTPQGDYLVFLPGECSICGTGYSAERMLEYVQYNGGVAVAAHPFRRGRSVSEYIIKEKRCTIVEAINGRNSDNENLLVKDWLDTYRLGACGGSDAHELDELGSVYTEFDSTIKSRNDLISALLNDSYYPVINQKIFK